MKNQILTIEQMQELQELNVSASMASMFRFNGEFVINTHTEDQQDWLNTPIGRTAIPTLTFFDILDMLNKNKSRYQVCVNYSYNLIKLIQDNGYEPVETVVEFHEDDIMTSAFKAVKWCLDNNEFEF